MKRPPRLIDLHCAWPAQYAMETTQREPRFYEAIPVRLGQLDGYLGATSAAVIAVGRPAGEWPLQPDRWASLEALIAGVEAEFCGRLLMGPADLARWRDDAAGLTWGCLGVAGLGDLIADPADLDRLPGLFERGVRVFQPAALAMDRADAAAGLEAMGIPWLEALAALAPEGPGPRPALDLAGLGSAAVAEALAWFDAEPGRRSRLIPFISHGGFDGEASSDPLGRSNLGRIRAMGGPIGLSVGPPFVASAEELAAAVEAIASLPGGEEGVALGTAFLELDRTLPGLENAESVVRWAFRRFGPARAEALTFRAGARLLARLAGGPNPSA